METIKTAAVVVLLLGVLYGVYVVLNKPELSPPPDVVVAGADLTVPDIQIGPGGEPTGPSASTSLGSEVQPGRMADSFPGIGSSQERDLSQASGPEPADSSTDPPVSEPLISENPEPALAESLGAAAPETRPNLVPPSDLEPSEPSPSIYGAAPNAPSASAIEEPSATVIAEASEPSSIYGAPPETTGGAPIAVDAASSPRSIRAFDNAWNSALNLIEQENWTEALLALSLRYNDSDLSPEERQRMLDLLDPLAGKVIYSREHTLVSAHVVQAGETLAQIAGQYEVPETLLQNINALRDPADLRPGMELKVVPGPFRAEIDREAGQLVLFARKLYAGRFPVSVGNDGPLEPGEYKVRDKQPGQTYVAPDGTRVAAGAADNPYGRWWLDLGANVSIHESPETLPAHGLGSISLKTADAADIYGILSVGSHVQIR